MTIPDDEGLHYSEINLPLIVSQDDINCTAYIIWDEARGEPLQGQRAVLDVILTRMVKRDMTACQVIKQPRQFSGWHLGMKMSVTKQMLTTYEIVSNMKPVVEQAEFFHAEYVKPAWRLRLDKIKQIAHHIFYAPKQKEKQK